MQTGKENRSTITYILAFLIGVILFWSFGKDWLDLKSVSVFLAGLIGVALAVLAFGTRSCSVKHPVQEFSSSL